jgi:hypothetical protein
MLQSRPDTAVVDDDDSLFTGLRDKRTTFVVVHQVKVNKLNCSLDSVEYFWRANH